MSLGVTNLSSLVSYLSSVVPKNVTSSAYIMAQIVPNDVIKTI
nr:MAG TPA: hypothetical protein [Crassvirales sp.]